MKALNFLTAAAPAAGSPGRLFIRVLLGLGLLSVLLHGMFLGHLARLSKARGLPYSSGPDTSMYLRSAHALRGEVPANPMYRERMLLPAMMATAEKMGWNDAAVLWLIILLECPATIALGYLGWALSGREVVGVLTAVLYVIHPDTYQNGVLLQTDVLHAQWVVMALACTMRFVRLRRSALAVGAGLVWMLAQLTRPTYFPVVAGFLVPWWAWRKNIELRRGFAMLAAMTVIVPFALTLSNYARYGLPSPSLCLAEMLETWTVPRAKALLRNAEHPAPMTKLFEDEVYKVRQTATWQTLHADRGTAADVYAAYHGSIVSNIAFLATNLSVTIDASCAELNHEIMFIPRFHNSIESPALNGTYPDPERWLGLLYKAGLLFCFAAVPLAFRGDRWPWFFLFAALVLLVLGPASLSWWCCGRYRYNVNIIVLPLVAIGALHPAGWAVLGATFVFGYVPVRLFHLSSGLLVLTALLAIGASWFVLMRRRRVA